MGPRLDPWLFALLVACHPAPGQPPPELEPVVPVASVASPTMRPVPATTPAPEPKPLGYEPCVPQMFDHEPGEHDRYPFEAATGRVGFRNAAGATAIPPRFRAVYPFSEHGVAGVYDDDGAAFIRPDGSVIARAFWTDNGPDYFTERRARIVKDGKVGFIDEEGEVVIPPRYDFASSFCHGMAAVCIGCQRQPGPHGGYEGGRWGFVTRTGTEVVPPRYEAVSRSFDEGGRAVVIEDGQELTIDRHGRPLPAEE